MKSRSSYIVLASNVRNSMRGTRLPQTHILEKAVRAFIEQMEPRLLFATYNVTGFSDGTGSVSGAGPFQATTLRAAINAANAAGGSNTINLPAGTYTVNAGALLSPALGSLAITSAIDLEGAGASSTVINGFISANSTLEAFPVFKLTQAAGAAVTINAVTVENCQGAAINTGGNATAVTNLTNDIFNNNSGSSDGTFSFGGGILASAGILDISNTTLSNNSAGEGGGIYNNGGTLALTNCTLSNNSGGSGAGIFNNSGTLTVTNSTIANNLLFGRDIAGGSTGAGNFNSYGGGIADAPQGHTMLFDATISGNTYQTGISGTVALGVGIADIPGAGPTFTIANTIIAGNTGTGDPDTHNALGVTSQGHNLIGATTGSSGWVASDLTGTAGSPLNAKLAPPANNGGLTQTMPPLTGSPAIGAGSTALVPNGVTTDQRGSPRIAGNSVDIGSVQVGSAVDSAPAIITNPANHNVPAGTDVTFTASASGFPAAAVQWLLETAGSNTFVPISGATSTTLDIGQVSVSQSGNKYEATFNNNVGSPVTTTAALLTVTPAPPLSVVVNTVSDTATGPGVVTLSDAVAAANSSFSATTISFAPTVFATPQTIFLTGTALDLTNAAQTTTITGPAAGVSINGNQKSGDFLIEAGATVSMSNLTVTGGSASQGGGISSNGNLNLNNVTVSGNSAGTSGFGGGIFVNSGTSLITASTITNNSAVNGGGIYNLANLTVTGSTVSGNTAGYFGGGITSGGGTLTLTSSTISNNALIQPSAILSPQGGGIDITSSVVNIHASTISGNINQGMNTSGSNIAGAPLGGGIAFVSGTLHISDSTIAGNQAIGGVNSTNAGLSGGGNGGGIFSQNATAATISSSTIAFNSVTGLGSVGGGLDAAAGGKFTIGDTIIAENIGSDVGAFDNGIFTSQGHNLVGVTDGSFTASGDQTGTAGTPLDPKFTTQLQNNGGPTLTLLPGAGSPAIDAGSNALALDTDGVTPLTADQRGSARIANTTVDIGSVEVAPASNSLVVTNTNDSGPGSLFSAVTFADNAATPSTITFDPNVFATVKTINLDGNELFFTNTGQAVTVTGPAVGVTINGDQTTKVIQVQSGVTVSLSNVTITGGNAPIGGGIYSNGNLTLTNSTVTSNAALGNSQVQGQGGGIDSASGTLNLTNVNVTNNAVSSAALASQGISGYGGGISIGSSTVKIIGSNISNNTATGDDAGIYNNTGTLSVDTSTISGNQAQITGGGIGSNGPFTLTNSTVSNNKAPGGIGGGLILNSSANNDKLDSDTISGNSSGDGAGIYGNATLTITNTTISSNTASDAGGGFYIGGSSTLTNDTIANNVVNAGSGQGGGLFISAQATGSFINGTISANTANVQGGGVIIGGAQVGIAGPASPATFGFGNSIIAGNSAPAGPDAQGTATSLGHNLVGKTDGSTGWVAGDLTGTVATPLNPKLGSLANNGGPTFTFLPGSGSPAIDAGSNALIPNGVTTDQRGGARIVNNTVDIGSVETAAVATTPVVTLTAPATGSSTKNNKPTFSGAAGTASGDSSTITIKIFSGNTATGTPVQTLTTTASAGAYSVAPTSALADGTYTAQASQSNTDGNTGTSAADTFTVDTVAPVVTLTAPSQGSTANSSTPIFGGVRGTAPGDIATVTIKIYSGNSATGTPVQTFNITANGPNYSFPPNSALADGTYTAKASQSDFAGNTGTSTANTFTVDTVAPVVTLTAPANNSTTGSTTPTFSGAAGTANGDSSTITIKIYMGNTATGTPVQTLTTTATNGNYSVAASSALSGGTYTAQASQSDTAGNTGTSSANTFTINTNLPAVTLTTPGSGSSTNNNKPTFSGAAGTASGDSSTITIKIFSGNTATGTPVQTLTTTASAGAYSVAPTSALADGNYTAQASQSNTDGNTGTSAAHTFTVDTVAPVVTLTAPANNSTVGSTTPTFYGAAGTAAGDSSTITIKIYNGNTATGTPVQTLTTTATNGNYSVAASSALSGGTYTAQASQSDTAGNTGTSAANTFTINTVLPTVTLASPANGTSTNNNKPTFSGGASNNQGDQSTITVNIYAGTTATGTPVQTLQATQSGGTYSVAATAALPDGTYTAQASHSDFSQHTGLSSANTFTVDTVAPVVTLTAPANGSSGTNKSPTFSGAAGTGIGDSSTVTIKIYSGNSATGTPVQTLTTTANGGNYSVAATPALATGTYTAVASQSDAAGNTGTSSPSTFTISQPAGGGGSLVGAPSTATTSYNLTQLGTSDWTDWATGGVIGNFNHKATGGLQISNVSEVGTGQFGGFNDPGRNLSWTDGTPTANKGNDHGFLFANNGIGAGYSFTAPADTTTRTLYVYLGGYSSGSTLTAHLSDGSAADFVVTFSSSGKYNDVVALTYNAGSSGATLIVTYVKTQNINGTNGSADLMAAWLGGPATRTAPTVITNPKTISVTPGATATFTASASGNPTPTVQWQVSTNGGASFADIAGATSTTYSFTAAQSDSGNKYEAVFTNSKGYVITAPATLTVASPSGLLSGVQAVAASSYNLTAVGTIDWAHWGKAGNYGNFDHKANVASLISNVTTLGTGGFGGFIDHTRNVSWTDGTPTASDADDSGYIWANNGIGAGFSFNAPADTTTRTIYVYLGGFSSGSTLTAHLSDGSAPDYVLNLSSSGHYNDIVAITYKAAAAGKKLTLSYVKSQNINGTNGSTDLIAAWLA